MSFTDFQIVCFSVSMVNLRKLNQKTWAINNY